MRKETRMAKPTRAFGVIYPDGTLLPYYVNAYAKSARHEIGECFPQGGWKEAYRRGYRVVAIEMRVRS